MIIEVNNALKNFHDGCKKIAQTLMENEGTVPITVALLVQSDDNDFKIGIAPDISKLYNEDKRVFVNAMKKIIEYTKPIAVAIITEAWLVRKTNTDDYNYDIPVKDQEGSIEAVVVQIETYKDASLIVYQINRDDDKVTLELQEDMSNIDKSNTLGNFTHLLKVNYEKFHNDIEQSLKNNLN